MSLRACCYSALMSVSCRSPIHNYVDSVLPMESLVTYAVISYLRSLTRYGARAYLPPLASNTLLVPSRLAFLQRSASGTACLRLS